MLLNLGASSPEQHPVASFDRRFQRMFLGPCYPQVSWPSLSQLAEDRRNHEACHTCGWYWFVLFDTICLPSGASLGTPWHVGTVRACRGRNRFRLVVLLTVCAYLLCADKYTHEG